MKIFEEMEKRGHEQLIFNYFEEVDLKLIISLHDTTLGRVIGGLRLSEYASDMDAIIESLKLSQLMTLQSATAEVDSGGGNVILLGDPRKVKNEPYFRALGRYIESLRGRIYIQPDLGTDSQDFKYIQRETDYTIFEKDRKNEAKPSSEVTASGVYWGVKACAKRAFGTSDLAGRTFAVQGIGDVGKNVVHALKQEDTKLYISDLVYDNMKEMEDRYPDIEIVRPEDILFLDVDFLVPCATAGIITPENVGQLRCQVIAGSAQHIFTDESLIQDFHQQGILYAPDFVISGGDLFLLDNHLKMVSPEEAHEGTKIIYNLLLDILQRAHIKGVPPYEIAQADAMARYQKIDLIKNILC